VHFTHHAREERYNICNGSNFGARLTIWDRLFGTYAEPPNYIPEVGLYGDKADYCKTPLRFVLDPYVRLYQELKQNNVRYWPAILFGSTAYNPPNPLDSYAPTQKWLNEPVAKADCEPSRPKKIGAPSPAKASPMAAMATPASAALRSKAAASPAPTAARIS
jgi:hypothetical protein